MPPKVLPHFPEPSDKPGIKNPIPEGSPGCLEGITFVITGTLPSLKRDDAKKLIEKYGGKLSSSISKKVNVLVCGSLEEGSTKLKKAQEYNIKMTDEAGLFSVIQASNPISQSQTDSFSELKESSETLSEKPLEIQTESLIETNPQEKITNQQDLSD